MSTESQAIHLTNKNSKEEVKKYGGEKVRQSNPSYLSLK